MLGSGTQRLPQWLDIVIALDRLTDHLVADGTPIDYGRRRHLDYTGLLSHDRWLEICRRTGTPPGTGRRERIARSQLFRHLSGLPAESVPDDLGGLDSAELRATSLRFTALQTPGLAHALQQEALSFLASHQIHDEPVTWQPPTTLLAGLSLPGSDPAHVDPFRLHQLVRLRQHPVQHAAQVLGTTVEAIRHVLDEHLAPASPLSENAARAIGRIRQQARQSVPAERFTQQHPAPRASGPQSPRHHRTGLAHRAMRPPPPNSARPRRRNRHEHCEHGPLGPHPQHPPPATRRSQPSHRPSCPRAGHRCPAILRAAMTSSNARQRLERFAAALPYSTVTEVARALGIHQSKLTTQINRLEKDLGRPLIERAERGRRMRPTPFSGKLAAAAKRLTGLGGRL